MFNQAVPLAREDTNPDGTRRINDPFSSLSDMGRQGLNLDSTFDALTSIMYGMCMSVCHMIVVLIDPSLRSAPRSRELRSPEFSYGDDYLSNRSKSIISFIYRPGLNTVLGRPNLYFATQPLDRAGGAPHDHNPLLHHSMMSIESALPELPSATDLSANLRPWLPGPHTYPSYQPTFNAFGALSGPFGPSSAPSNFHPSLSGQQDFPHQLPYHQGQWNIGIPLPTPPQPTIPQGSGCINPAVLLGGLQHQVQFDGQQPPPPAMELAMQPHMDKPGSPNSAADTEPPPNKRRKGGSAANKGKNKGRRRRTETTRMPSIAHSLSNSSLSQGGPTVTEGSTTGSRRTRNPNPSYVDDGEWETYDPSAYETPSKHIRCRQ